MLKYVMTLLVALTGFTTQAQAETIHGVCDPLQGTGGAYGLCVAICEVPAESEECDITFLDGNLVEESFENCRPAQRKLVDKFFDKAPAGTELPCGNYTTTPVEACPCEYPQVADFNSVSLFQDSPLRTTIRGIAFGNTNYSLVTGIQNDGSFYCARFSAVNGVVERVILAIDEAELAQCQTELRAIGELLP